MKDLFGVIIFYLTMPIWVVTFLLYYGIYMGVELAKKFIEAMFEGDSETN